MDGITEYIRYAERENFIYVADHIMKPTAEYPFGSWMRAVGSNVEVATGYYATKYPNKPSPYKTEYPPFVIMEQNDELPWREK